MHSYRGYIVSLHAGDRVHGSNLVAVVDEYAYKGRSR